MVQNILVNGKRNGSGILLYSNGDKYEGDWKNDKKHGIGVTISKYGGQFETKWLDGRLVEEKLVPIKNYGVPEIYKNDTTIVFSNGDKYIGKWENGNSNGQGILKWKFVGKYHGEGVVISIDGSEFETEWIAEKLPEQQLIPVKPDWDSEKHKKDTTIIYANGDKYIGQWKDGKSNGPGSLIYPNGDKYKGEWKNGKKHGIGVTISKDGKIIEEGAYKDGKKEGLWVIFYENGQKQIELTYIDGKKEGFTTGWHDNGKVWYEGTYNGKILIFEKCWDVDGNTEECD